MKPYVLFCRNNAQTMEDQIIIRIDTKDKEAGQRVAESSNRTLSDYVRLVLADAVSEGKKV